MAFLRNLVTRQSSKPLKYSYWNKPRAMHARNRILAPSHDSRRLLSKRLLSLVVIISLGTFATLSVGALPIAHAETLETWNSTNGAIDGTSMGTISCATYAGYVYCLGGSAANYNTAYAPILSSGIGTWSYTTAYPMGSGVGSVGGINSASCATNSGYIYCVGGQGEGSGAGTTDYALYAPLSSSGIGQ